MHHYVRSTGATARREHRRPGGGDPGAARRFAVVRGHLCGGDVAEASVGVTETRRPAAMLVTAGPISIGRLGQLLPRLGDVWVCGHKSTLLHSRR